ncbi:MAG: membrane protein insertion efficiency factor YidD [Candidatus Omnitrophota bacterium]
MKRFFYLLVCVYQKIGALFFVSPCRFYPTCSSYALEAVDKYGLIKGIPRVLWRILKCSPFSKGGYDPVK